MHFSVDFALNCSLRSAYIVYIVLSVACYIYNALQKAFCHNYSVAIKFNC